MQRCLFLFLLFILSTRESTLEGHLLPKHIVCAAGLFAFKLNSHQLQWKSFHVGFLACCLIWCSSALSTGNSQTVSPTKCPLKPHSWKPHESQLLLSFSLLLRSASRLSECAEAFCAETPRLMQLWFTAPGDLVWLLRRSGKSWLGRQICSSYIKNTVIGVWLASSPRCVSIMAF